MKTLKNARVFLVDDDPFIIEYYSHHLHALGLVNVVALRDGESCLEAIRKTQPDLIFLDQNMNDLCGLRVLKLIRSSGFACKVVMVTSDENVGLALDVMRSGAHDLVIKGPDELDRITSIVADLFISESELPTSLY
jgi:DNA-binding NtrC family response regulator